MKATMNNIKENFRVCTILVAVILFQVFISCSNSPSKQIIGEWYHEDPAPEGFWDAHDAISYQFADNDICIKSGGPEPLDPTEYLYKLVGDSILTILDKTSSERIEQYKIDSFSSDTIWLENHSEYFVNRKMKQF